MTGPGKKAAGWFSFSWKEAASVILGLYLHRLPYFIKMADTLSKEKRSALMSRIHSSDTVPEKKVRSALWKRGFRYRLNSKALPGSPDIVLPKYRTVVFVNGCFWHGHENCALSSIPKTNTEWWSNKLRNNRRRDALVSAHLEGLGWSVETVWECETVPAKTQTAAVTVNGPWTVKFQENRGAPEKAVFNTLHSLTEENEFGIKYFSGVSSYNNTVSIPNVSGETYLDLGEVKYMAEVWVNGQYCGRAWKQPYRVDISSAVKEGENQIEVKVASSWVNRLVGDLQPEAKEKVTYTDAPRAFNKDMDILPAGLLGPVKVLSME